MIVTAEQYSGCHLNKGCTMLLNPDEYEDARQSRDARFDGRFFVGVLTTGIYCRPVCPVKIPMKKNVQLYPTAAAASAAGFRPCLRCRPESSPGTPAWNGSSWKVSRALQLIDQGYLDDGSVEDLANEIDVGSRQLGRLFQDHIGASPIEVAKTRRLHFAKKLIDETNLPLAEICFASGFGSVRRFNAVFVKTYDRTPKELRQRKKSKLINGSNAIEMTLSFRPPFAWKKLLAFLAYRHIPGVEHVTENSYARTISIEGVIGDFRVEFSDASTQLKVQINFPESRQLHHIIDRIRTVFDLRADSEKIESFFARDKILGPIVKKNSGLRVPGSWNGFEVAVRAVLGQQVTVKAATTLVGRIANSYGQQYSCDNPNLTRIFPSPETLLNRDLNNMGIVGQRIAAIKQIAEMVGNNDLTIDCTASTDSFVEKICSIKGIGEWTAYYIAMRALSDPDAFPYSDLILRRAATRPGDTLTAKQLLQLSEAWKPWRAYSVILLWAHYGGVHKLVMEKAKTAKLAQTRAAKKLAS
jgi:AraC family transcriptional regulator of adaptative response / DNA-3-methyladenine glycosylase II